MTKFEMRHLIHIDQKNYWDKLFFNEECNEHVFRDRYQFGYELLVLEDQGGEIFRSAKVVPQSDMPAAVRKVLGDSASYTETGVWDKEDMHYRFDIITSTMSDKIKIKGDLWAEANGEGEVVRVCLMSMDVKIFGVGKIVESFLSNRTQEDYKKSAQYLNEYIQKKGF